jgi:energy-coupling factor transporter ATP-binding protein EcfA2
VSVNPPGHLFWDPRVTDSQLAQYAELCRADAACAARTPNLTAGVLSASRDTTVRVLSQYAMHHNGPASAPNNAPTLVDAYLSGDAGACGRCRRWATLRPTSGRVLLDAGDVLALTARQAARHVAALPQERGTDFELSVREVVAMGRTPYQRAFAGEDPEDRRVIATALEQVGMAADAGRGFSTLSGGERQRVLLARAFTQLAPDDRGHDFCAARPS